MGKVKNAPKKRSTKEVEKIPPRDLALVRSLLDHVRGGRSVRRSGG